MITAPWFGIAVLAFFAGVGQAQVSHIFTDRRPIHPISGDKILGSGKTQCGPYFRRWDLPSGATVVGYNSEFKIKDQKAPAITREFRDEKEVSVVLDDSAVTPTAQLLFEKDQRIRGVIIRLSRKDYVSAAACLPPPGRPLQK
jgi:hypothetical protein